MGSRQTSQVLMHKKMLSKTFASKVNCNAMPFLTIVESVSAPMHVTALQRQIFL